MGTLKVTIAVGDSQGRQFEELDVTVDTGSTYTTVPRAMLIRMGDPGRKVATLRDCRRQHRPRRRRRSHHQAALCKPPKARRQNENRCCRATESSTPILSANREVLR